MSKFIVAAVLSVLSYPLFADTFTASSAAPAQVHVFPNAGMFVFYATVTSGTPPICNGENRWSLKTDKPGAKELVSMVVAAKVSGRDITVVGTGNCNPDGMGYEISHLYLN